MKNLSKEAEQVVYRTKRRVESVTCDICERVITPDPKRADSSRYFRVITGHNDWGNDSCDSIEHYDICPHCIGSFVAKYALESTGTEYLEMRNEYLSTIEYEYD